MTTRKQDVRIKADQIVDLWWDSRPTVFMDRMDRSTLADAIAQALESARWDALEEAARLCKQTRCRDWSPTECADQIRTQLKGESK